MLLGQYGPRSRGNVGNLGSSGNVKSVGYGNIKARDSSNPSLSAINNQKRRRLFPLRLHPRFFSMSVELRKMRHASETQLASMFLRNFKGLAIWAAEISSLQRGDCA